MVPLVSFLISFCRRTAVVAIAATTWLLCTATALLPVHTLAQDTQPVQPQAQAPAPVQPPVVVSAAPSILSNIPIGQSISGFDYPDEQNGVLIQQLRGSRATKASEGRIDIKDLNLKRFKNGALDMVMIMPLANFYVLERKLATDKGVMIQFSDREIRADEMIWDMRNNSGALKKNVKVVLKGFDIGSTSKTTAPAVGAAPADNGQSANTLPLPSITLPTDNTQAPGATQNGQPVQPSPIPDASAPLAPFGQPGDVVLPPAPTSPTAP